MSRRFRNPGETAQRGRIGFAGAHPPLPLETVDHLLHEIEQVISLRSPPGGQDVLIRIAAALPLERGDDPVQPPRIRTDPALQDRQVVFPFVIRLRTDDDALLAFVPLRKEKPVSGSDPADTAAENEAEA